MNCPSRELLEDLTQRTHKLIEEAQAFYNHSEEELNQKPRPGAWSVLECLEHLNLYGDFYIPEFRKRMRESLYPANAHFKSGLIGNYFAKAMLPKEKLNKMKTFSDKNPAGSKLGKDILDRFMEQQKALLEILKEAEKADLTKIKCTITISSLLKIKLGDTLRVIIYHNQRHMVQAQKCLKDLKLPA